VHLGASAGPQATLSSAALRGKTLVIMGHTNFAAPPEIKAEAYRRMARAAARGELRMEVLEMPLEQVEEAWRQLQASAHRKIVLVP
jgi:NADPH:quinone reductase-like Zn-dependent oxidoreductase